MELLDAPRQPFLQDETISEHYEVRRLLGEGGFGHVFEAWDAKLCRSVALKRLKPQADLQHPEKLIKEARLAASLRHSAFVRIFSIDGNGHGQSIVMELVEGQTLGQFMQGAPVALDTALDIASQIADAMDEAHAMDLVHGDLKPSNLMIEADGKVRILDFGLARQLDPQATQTTALGDLQGTIAYMAPERLMGRPPDMRGDIYALGAMLYEMLAGERPFSHLNGLALAAAHMQPNAAWPALPDTVPPAIDALVRSMTAHEPMDRPRTMGDVRRALATGAYSPSPANIALNNDADSKDLSNLPKLISIQVHVPLKHVALLACTLVLLVLGIWKSKGISEAISQQQNKAGYSEIASMKAGMDALRVFDQDESQAQAIHHFMTVLQHSPNNAAAAAGLSLASSFRYIGNGRDMTWLQRAEATAQQALLHDNQLALAHAALAWVRELQGKTDDALRETSTSLNLEPNNMFALFGKTRFYLAQQNFEMAEAILKQARTAHPEERMFNMLTGVMHYKKNDYVAAEKVFRDNVRLYPESPGAYAYLNAALLRQGRENEALAVLQEGLSVRPHWELYNNLGTSLFAKGDYSGAVNAFENAVSEKKGSPGAYMLWANLADAQRWIPALQTASRNSYNRAIDLLQPMLARLPDDITLNSRLALYQSYAGEKTASIRTLQHALKLAPKNADVLFRAALTYELNNYRTEAVEALLQASSLGYPINLIESAPDLLNLRRDSRYQNFLLNLERNTKK